MDRRTFLKTSTAAAAATTATAGSAQAVQSFSDQALATPAIATARHELRIAVPDTSHLADAALELTRDIEIASGGRIVLHRSKTSAPSADGINVGTIDGAYGHVSEVCAAPELALFSGLPGDLALSPDNLLTWMTAAAGDMFLDEAADGHGLTALIAGHSGPATGLWADRDIADLHAFASATIETIGFGRRIADRINAAYGVAPAAGGRTPQNHDGRANLIERAAAPIEAYAGLPEPNRHTWYRQGLHDQGFAIALVLGRDAWNRLSGGDQLLVGTIARAAAHRDLARHKASDRLVAPGIFASLPTVRKPLPADVAAAIQHTARHVVHDAMAENSPMQPAFQAYAAFYEGMMGVPLPRVAGAFS